MSSSDHQSPEAHHGGDLVEEVADHFVDREERLGAPARTIIAGSL